MAVYINIELAVSKLFRRRVVTRDLKKLFLTDVVSTPFLIPCAYATVPTTAEGTPFPGSMNAALCDL